MTDKEAVLDALNRLPENVSLDEIADELQIMASVRRARVDISAGRSKGHAQVKELLGSWASEWAGK
jgi:hypothetical protein